MWKITVDFEIDIWVWMLESVANKSFEALQMIEMFGRRDTSKTIVMLGMVQQCKIVGFTKESTSVTPRAIVGEVVIFINEIVFMILNRVVVVLAMQKHVLHTPFTSPWRADGRFCNACILGFMVLFVQA